MRKMPGIAIICLLMLTSCGYDRFDGLGKDDIENVTQFRNADLSLLYQHYYGDSFVIHEDMVFEGYVTATDKSGNFFRSFIVEDGTAAVEVRAGFYDLHTIYQQGRRLVIRAKGLSVGKYNGIIQLGLKQNLYNNERVEEFGSRIVLDEYIKRDREVGFVHPYFMMINEFMESDCGRLIRTEKVKLVSSESVMWGENDGSVFFSNYAAHKFKDHKGDSVFVVTSTYADFADILVPTDSVVLTGILMRDKFVDSKNVYALKLRDIDDVD